jgi:hypothetical protein
MPSPFTVFFCFPHSAAQFCCLACMLGSRRSLRAIRKHDRLRPDRNRSGLTDLPSCVLYCLRRRLSRLFEVRLLSSLQLSLQHTSTLGEASKNMMML